MHQIRRKYFTTDFTFNMNKMSFDLKDFNVFCSHDIGSSSNSNIKLSNKLRPSILSNTNMTTNNDDDDLIQAEKMVNLKLSKSNSSLAVKSEPVKTERTEILSRTSPTY